MNENIKLLCDYEINIEIYCDNGKVQCCIATDHATAEYFPVTCIADVSKALDQVLVDAAEYEMQKLEEEE